MDTRKNINKNLSLVSKKMKISKNRLMLMYQTHSNRVIVINNKNRKNIKFKSDAIITNIKGLALGVVTADCVPIILFDLRNHIIGCIHAGWKGAYSGIIENTIKKFRKLSTKNKIYASVGPCIGSKSYEVDLDFYNNFIMNRKENYIYFLNKKEIKNYLI